MDYDPKKIDLLLVDDDADFRETVARRFVRRGFRVQESTHGEQALQLASLREFDVIVLDMVMPGMSGIQVLEQLKLKHPECEVILLTGQGTIETAVQAMKLGAYDFLTKPFPLADLETLIGKAYERRQLRKENVQLKAVLSRAEKPPVIVGESPAMQEVFRLIDRAGPTDKAILIEGESGTGKELVAKALQLASDEPTNRWSSSTVPPCPKHCSKASYSAMKKGLSPVPSRPSPGCSKWPTAARCSSTKSASWRAPCRPSCCACSKTGR